MLYGNTYNNWETAQRLTCRYELFSQTVRLKKTTTNEHSSVSVQLLHVVREKIAN
jgi:hypothetical protein